MTRWSRPDDGNGGEDDGSGKAVGRPSDGVSRRRCRATVGSTGSGTARTTRSGVSDVGHHAARAIMIQPATGDAPSASSSNFATMTERGARPDRSFGLSQVAAMKSGFSSHHAIGKSTSLSHSPIFFGEHGGLRRRQQPLRTETPPAACRHTGYYGRRLHSW